MATLRLQGDVLAKARQAAMSDARTATDPPDRGADGPAYTSRPYVMAEVLVDASTPAAAVRRYEDSTLPDRLHHYGQINDRQHSAACDLLTLYTAAGVEPVMVVRLTGDRGKDTPEHQCADLGPSAWDFWSRAMQKLGRPEYEAVVIEALQGIHPGIRRLATLQEALDKHADNIRLPRGGV